MPGEKPQDKCSGRPNAEMGRSGIKTGILTSSRADYGIYRPLLKAMANDPFFDLHIIAFGTHISEKYGNTIDQIKIDGYNIAISIDTLPEGDTAQDIARTMGKTLTAFSKVWAEHSFDLVFALGDRYEMFAAVSAALPFNVKIAHIHGGETTLGAIDNAFRHSITSMAHLHFTAAEPYRKRVAEITKSEKNVFNVGALSIDNINQIPLLSIEEFKEKSKIDLELPSILITFHPETVGFEKNKVYVNELIAALKDLKEFQLIITMPNADTMGLYIREKLQHFIDNTPNAIGVENFGNKDYLTCMKHCKLMLGNTSSGFIEAAGFNKPVVNLGDRQKGRIITPNIFNTPINKTAILENINKAMRYNSHENIQIYGDGNAADKICNILKSIH
jgi:GDP/UDP-N,N'-diacetylbacillosamine 2-epimerase (hydrolysing)